MDLLEAISLRHSVRHYNDRKICGDTLASLTNTIEECNSESGMNIQLCLDEPDTFDSLIAHYGNFVNVKNYVALVGKSSPELDEKAGYYGEKIALAAQMLGLNTCWVALSFNRKKIACKINKGERLVLVIAIGYSNTNGKPHNGKSAGAVSNLTSDSPLWFKNAMDAVMLAPTAMNQQKFYFGLAPDNKTVTAHAKTAFYSKVDLGIAKYHFETGADGADFVWKK